MMLFRADLMSKVLSGEKTQTRRLSGKYEVGKTYAVQPGRGKKAVARIRVLRVWLEDVRFIRLEDVYAEGFPTHKKFWTLWATLHDKSVRIDPKWGELTIFAELFGRPAEFYEAWAIEFELVRDEPAIS